MLQDLYLLRAGKLPGRRPDRVWGGSGYGGSRCTLCGGFVRDDQVALEVEFGEVPAETNHRLHIRCFLALESVLTEREMQEAAASAIGVANSRPALSALDSAAKIAGHEQGQAPAGGTT